jgi:cytochrome b subunit of formate dehydrogenase
LKGSQIAADQNACLTCHGDASLWDAKNQRLFISKEKLADDVHFLKGVNCHDCHGGAYQEPDLRTAHAAEDGFRTPMTEVKKACVYCHKEQNTRLNESVHGKAGEKRDEAGRGTPMECSKCHGTVSHGLIAARDPRSPLFPDNQVQTCDRCHREKLEAYKNDLETYTAGVHGHGLFKSGLQVTAVCADCHGSHGIYYSSHTKSSLHPSRVAATCGKCHRFIEERLQASVHARGNGAGTHSDREAPGGKGKRKPSCTDCHQGHDQLNPDSPAFRLQLPYRCGNCHANLSNSYAMSIHGELTELGYGPAAKCSDCHGAHDILPMTDAASRLAPANRAETCGKCHLVGSGNFIDFDPHLDHTDADRSALVHGVYVFFLTLLFTTFGVFGVHTILWFIRSLVHVWKHGRPKGLVPGATAYVRFVPFHRRSHVLLMISFLGLALTGLPLKYSDTGWAKEVAYVLGGFESTSVWHRVFALTTFGCFFVYIGRMIYFVVVRRRESGSLRTAVFGPDSPVPNWRDLRDVFRMARWFLGLGPKPTFERWTYWEKFDFWGACADVVIIGFTGLILWFPNLFTAFLPAVSLNIAKVIHSTQALLATGFVFAVHFFNTHFRADKFPADMSALTGLVSEEEMLEERPEYLERMRASGELEERRTTVPSRRRLWTIKLLGFLALAVGLALLVGMILAGLEK